jgi:hypothetical protein
MIRFVLFLFLFYFGYRFVKNLFGPTSSREEIHGQNRNQPLDLRDSDVEDARFEDVNDDKK